MANIHSTITYNANLSAAQAQIKVLTAQIGTLTAAFNTLDKSALTAQRSLAATFAAGVGQAGGFTTSTIKATNAVETFGKQLAANRLTMRDYFREAITGYTRQNSMMRRLAEQQVKYQQSIAVPVGGGQAMMMTPQSINAASSAAALASQRFAVFNQLMNGGATAMLNWGKNTQWAGRQLMVGFTVPLMLFTAVASKQFRELDKELTRFQKVYGADLGNAISESTNRMREQVKQLAYDISSTYGIAAKDTAALAADIAATGKEGEALISSVQQTTRLAVLGEVDRQEAMKATLSLQSAFRMNTNELAESINFLNAVENQTSATLEDLATAIPKVGPVVRSLGGDVKDLATLLVAMREGGIPAAEAANALKSGLSALINPTKQASDVAKQFGIDLVGIVEANKGQLMPTIYAMQEALGNLDSFGRSRVIEQIFGRYQFARITALFDNIGRAGSQTESVVELASKSSADLAKVANDELRTLTESTAMRFQRTLEDLKNAIMPIGQTLTETLIPIFEFIGSGMKTLTSFFQALPGPVKDFAKYGVAIAALAGPIIMMVGLFGNLIANGIKFGMMMTRLGARIAGVRVEKFELLNQDVMAAKLGVDNLTKSFDTQEVALRRLSGVLSSYEQSLRRLTAANPALFIPGALPGARGQTPIRRQAGSTNPEFVPGSGRGDKIPAMLEPGEFIVNREATEKYGPVLLQMNRGTLPGFQTGTLSLTGGQSSVLAPYTMFAPGNTPSGFGMSRDFFDAGDMFEKSMRASAMTAVAIERKTRLTDKALGRLSTEMQPITEQVVSALRLTATEMIDAGEDVTHISQVMERARPRIDAIVSSISDPKMALAMQKLLTPTTSQILSGGNVRIPAVVIDPVTKEITRRTQYSDRTGEARSFQNRVKTSAQYLGVPTSGGYTRAHLGTERLSGSIMPLGGGALGSTPEVRRIARQALDEYLISLDRGFDEVTRSTSPSKEADKIGESGGRNVGQGVLNGLQRGLNNVTQGRNVIKTGGGIESISNAQKIAQADQSILKLKEMQLKHTANRVRAEVELNSIQSRYARGEITLVQMMEEKRRLQSEIKAAADKELRIQNIINQKKQAIADADQAQLRAEQEEAKAAQRRASAAAPGLNKPIGPTGPAAAIGSARNQAQGGMRGAGAMNAMFALSMVTSSISMMGGASADAAMKLGLFTTALMTATMMMNMGIGKNTFTNFLGMRSLGGKLGQTNAARLAANPALAQRASSIASAGGLAGGRMAGQGAAAGLAAGGGKMGATLLGASRLLSVAGGPIGIAAGLGITAAITGFMMYRNAAEEARERAISAFNDPVKSAEYFGETIANVSDILENNRLSNVSEDLRGIDSALREAVKEDYGPLIEKIKYLSAGAGAQELSMAYSNMIISGMSAENAKASIEAIAAEAGMAGGKAFTEAVTQGFLDESLTVKDAVDNIISQFQPSEAKFGKTGKTILQTLEDERQSLINERTEIESRITYSPVAGTYGPPAQIMAPEDQQRLYDISNAIDGINDQIQDLMEVNPEMISGVMDSLVMAYQQDPTAAIEGLQEFTDIINNLDEGNQASAMEKITDYLKNAYGQEWDRIGGTIDTQEEKIVAIQMAIAGVSLDKATNEAGEFDIALGRAVVSAKSLADATKLLRIESEQAYFDMIDQFAQEQRDTINTNAENYMNAVDDRIKIYQDLKESAQDAFEVEQKAREDSIEGMQEEMDARRRSFDEEMDRLDDRRNAIEKSSDAYIKSLEKNQKAESFFAQQRKTAFGALEKLASGDVFGFLQEREQMSADAQEFSYDQMIEGIEERRDLELEAIDEVREQKQEEQEEYEQMMEDRIKGVQDLMDQEQEAHDAQMKRYDDMIERSEENKEKILQAKNDELKKIETMEKDYRTNATSAERKYSQEYSELKSKPYLDARKEMLKLRIEEIYYRGGVSAIQAAIKAGALSFDARGRSASLAAENILKELGLNLPSTPYVVDNVGDTGVGDDLADTVQQMNVDAQQVTLNGDINIPESGRNYDGTEDRDGNPSTLGAATGGYIKNNRLMMMGGGKVSGPGGPKSDEVPAMLSNGEYVVQASSVNKYGKDMMDTINAGKFAYGGPVSTSRAASDANATFRGNLPSPIRMAEGGLVESIKKFFPNGGHQFYAGWNQYNSWSKGKPQLVTMHHTALQPGVSQQAELNSFAKDWMGKPVVQSWIGKSGVAHTLAAGNTGMGHGEGTTKYMKGETESAKEIIDIAGHPNSVSWQMEVSSAGKTQDFTSGQFNAIARMTAAIRDWAGWPGFEGRIINHKDWAIGRRNDTLYPISTFVKNANEAWTEGGNENTNNNENKGGKNTGKKNPENPVGDSIQSYIRPVRGLPGILSLLNKGQPNQDRNNPRDNPSQPGSRDVTLDPKDYQDEFIKGFNLVKLIYGSGWKTKDDVRTAYGVVMGESSGKRTATNDNWAKGSKGIDWGLWQINDYWHKEVGGEKIDFSKSRMFDAIYNSKIANAMWKDPKNHGGSTQTPWGGWNVHPVSGVFPGGSDGYRRGINEFDNNPNWWRQIVSLTGGSNGGSNDAGQTGGGAASKAVSYARNQLGKPYVNTPPGARPPDSWDCSKLTAWAWNQAIGKNVLTAYSHTQASELTKRVSGLKNGKISGLSLGDVLYFKTDGASGGHTSIYAGNDTIIEASTPATGVRTTSVNNGWNNTNRSNGTPRFQWAGPPKGYAMGGFISGPGGPRSDMIPAMLSNGEYVIKASSVAKYGKGFMDQINSGSLNPSQGSSIQPARFANGGMVGSAPMPAFSMPEMADTSVGLSNTTYGGNSSSSSNKTNVKVVINGAGGKGANAIANKVVSMINSANNRRNHSRSI